jgi:hypothetical protein
MLNFKTRSAARAFASKIGRSVVDNGTNAAKRWSVKVLAN